MPLVRTRGFRLRRRLVKVFNWCIHRRTRRRSSPSAEYQRLQPSVGPISKFRKWVRSLRCGARGLCSGKSHSGYLRVGQEPVAQQVKSPKGHLAVYVGEEEGDTCRVLVPVIYFNHPLFGELLREAENVYGFDHPGGIQIPCPRSELDSVKMKIDAVSGGGGWRRRRRRTRSS